MIFFTNFSRFMIGHQLLEMHQIDYSNPQDESSWIKKINTKTVGKLSRKLFCFIEGFLIFAVDWRFFEKKNQSIKEIKQSKAFWFFQKLSKSKSQSSKLKAKSHLKNFLNANSPQSFVFFIDFSFDIDTMIFSISYVVGVNQMDLIGFQMAS